MLLLLNVIILAYVIDGFSAHGIMVPILSVIQKIGDGSFSSLADCYEHSYRYQYSAVCIHIFAG